MLRRRAVTFSFPCSVLAGWRCQILFVCWLAVLGHPMMSVLRSDGAETLVDGFESSDVSWSAAGADCHVRPLRHQRVTTEAHSGQGSEWIHIQAEPGTYVYYSHPIGLARVIPELELSVWVKASRSGLQLMARVVFPRNTEPRTGKPLTTWIRGSSYSQVGQWEQLSLHHVPTLVSRATQVMRSQIGPQVDPREAFLDLAVLNVYGGPNLTSVWIDDLATHHQVDTSNLRAGSVAPRSVVSRLTDHSMATAQPTEARDPGTVDPAQLEGSVLVAGGRPLFPRLMQYHGESFELIRALAMNGIVLPMVPTPEQLESASRLGLWLVAPPPDTNQIDQIGPEFNSVLAWDVGHRLSTPDLDATRRLSNAVRRADPISARPVLCNVHSEHLRFSRYANVLLVGRDTLQTSFDLREYGPWLYEQRKLARPLTPVWAAMQTDIHPDLIAQWKGMGVPGAEQIGVESEQMRLLAYTLIASGARGLCFASHHRISPDVAMSSRAAALGLLNLELELLAPWAAAGKPVASVRTSDPQVHVTVLGLERSRLVLPIRYVPDSQYTAGALDGKTVSFIVPGVPSSSEALLVTSSRLKPLRQKRVTGGMRISLEDFDLASAIVMTQDPLVVGRLTRQLAAQSVRRSRFAHDVATQTATTAEATLAQLSGAGAAAPNGNTLLSLARQSLGQCQQRFRAGEYELATEYAEHVMRRLSQVRRATWEQASGQFRWPVASPVLMHFSTLPMHWELARRLASVSEGTNELAAGDFESLTHMLQHGWEQEIETQPNLQGDVELTPHECKTGNYSLHLRAWSNDPSQRNPIVAVPPVVVRSAAVRAEPGQLLRIQGWVKIPQPIVGSRDGLLIAESAGGNNMGIRIRQTNDWQQFVLYRTANETGQLRIMFSLGGLGEAFVDTVSLHPIHYSPAADESIQQAMRLRQVLPPPQ